MSKNLNVEGLGQVFTNNTNVVKMMLALQKRTGMALEPSCGDGAIFNKVDNCIGIEYDSSVCPQNAINQDFFLYDVKNKFDTVIGNPPYVRFNNIDKSTMAAIKGDGYGFNSLFDERANLYLFFIYKAILHLNEGGELIFLTPRDFFKATASIRLNQFIYGSGTITDVIDFGDKKIFDGFSPNCVVWRFQKGLMDRKAICSKVGGDLVPEQEKTKKFDCLNGQLLFTTNEYILPFKTLFYVKVGAVSGADEIFKNEDGNRDFITSETERTGNTKKFFYNVEAKQLVKHKQKLLKRKVKAFSNETWYKWGRDCFESKDIRVYVNCKTRNLTPFYTHSCESYDGSVLGIFPKNQKIDIHSVTEELNKVDWDDLGFVCDGRFIFSQRALEDCYLPKSFLKYL